MLTAKSLSVSMKFGNGTTASGATKIMSVSIGQLDKDEFDGSKAYNLATAISRLYDQVMLRVEATQVSYLS